MENTVPGYPHSVAIYSTFFSKYWYLGDDNAMHIGTSTGNWEEAFYILVAENVD